MGIGDRIRKKLSGKKDADKIIIKNGSESDNSCIEDPTPLKDYKYNFKYLVDLMSSSQDEIKLEHDIILGDGEEVEFPHGIEICHNIDGNGHSIDAREKTKVFVNEIHFRGERVVKNLTIKNAFSPVRGGAGFAFEYTSNGVMTFINCTFENNHANSGGAISNAGRLNLIDCTFKNNHADLGGAISNERKLNLINCTFIENSADEAGAIYNTIRGIDTKLPNTYELNVKECTFIKNFSRGIADVIENTGKGSIIIEDCTFENNNSRNGMIFNPDGNLKIFNSEFYKNDSWENSVIVLNNSFLTVENTIFKNNTVKFIICNATRFMSISHGKFCENVVKSTIHNAGQSGNIINSIFKNNIPASEEFLANIINESDLALNDVKISSDKKTILNEGNLIIQNDIKDIECTIENRGSIDYFSQDSKNTFEELEILINESKSSNIMLKEDFSLHVGEKYFFEGGIELDRDGLVIDGNGHTIDGGDNSRIFFITGKNITLKNIVFKKGHSFENYEMSRNSNGGALRIYHNASLKIENCQFIGNVSEKDGGAIYNQGELLLYGSSFSKNYLKPYSVWDENFRGCALYNDGELTVEDTNFNNNHVADYTDYDTFGTLYAIYSEGGGIFNNQEGHATLTRVRFQENNADYGGAIYNQGELTIIDCDFRPEDIYE